MQHFQCFDHALKSPSERSQLKNLINLNWYNKSKKYDEIWRDHFLNNLKLVYKMYYKLPDLAIGFYVTFFMIYRPHLGHIETILADTRCWQVRIWNSILIDC